MFPHRNQGRKIALFVCDMQERLRPHIFNFNSVEKNILMLIRSTLVLSQIEKVIVCEFIPEKLGKTVDAIHKTAQSHNRVLNGVLLEIQQKEHYTMMDERLRSYLISSNINEIILTGIQTEWCITQTALDLLRYGYDTNIVIDATGSQDIFEHKTAIERMTQHGAKTCSTRGILSELITKKDSLATRWFLSEISKLHHHHP